jgi:Holliday junction resolvasome RuvABC endonuclease subunit
MSRRAIKVAKKSTARPERVLALDVSSVCVGWANLDGPDLGSHGRFHPVGKHHGEKLCSFHTWLNHALVEFEPDQLVVETPYPGRRSSAYGVLSMYLGVVLSTYFAWAGQELPDDNRMPPNLVKQMLKVRKGATHDERKLLMIKEINRRFGLRLVWKAGDKLKKVSQDDTADAIAAGLAWLLKFRPAAA